MTEATTTGGWPRRLTLLALALSIGGALAALAAAVGSGGGLWAYGTGFTILRYAFYAAMAGGVVAIVALALSWKAGGRLVRWNFAALLIAVGFALYLLPQIATAKRLPGIHDISTDLTNPPQFAALSVRADNLDKVPDDGRAELAAMAPEDRWKALHREAYGDVRPLRVRVGAAEALRRAEALVRKRGWEIARVEPANGTIEATATTLFFRFRDDVAIRVTPDPAQPAASIIDMRSISRVGGSDVGVNAERIRGFLADLEASSKP
jgi:uncharacterized protein (DUF1499 family)